jgi:hypothetical protein
MVKTIGTAAPGPVQHGLSGIRRQARKANPRRYRRPTRSRAGRSHGRMLAIGPRSNRDEPGPTLTMDAGPSSESAGTPASGGSPATRTDRRGRRIWSPGIGAVDCKGGRSAVDGPGGGGSRPPSSRPMAPNRSSVPMLRRYPRRMATPIHGIHEAHGRPIGWMSRQQSCVHAVARTRPEPRRGIVGGHAAHETPVCCLCATCDAWGLIGRAGAAGRGRGPDRDGGRPDREPSR